MNSKKAYCEECVEEIPNDEVYWDDKRLYCGRCGSEIEAEDEIGNVFETIAGQGAGRLSRMEDEDFDEEGDDEMEEEDEEDSDYEVSYGDEEE